MEQDQPLFQVRKDWLISSSNLNICHSLADHSSLRHSSFDRCWPFPHAAVTVSRLEPGTPGLRELAASGDRGRIPARVDSSPSLRFLLAHASPLINPSQRTCGSVESTRFRCHALSTPTIACGRVRGLLALVFSSHLAPPLALCKSIFPKTWPLRPLILLREPKASCWCCCSFEPTARFRIATPPPFKISARNSKARHISGWCIPMPMNLPRAFAHTSRNFTIPFPLCATSITLW